MNTPGVNIRCNGTYCGLTSQSEDPCEHLPSLGAEVKHFVSHCCVCSSVGQIKPHELLLTD
jgi:hypothetical protein